MEDNIKLIKLQSLFRGVLTRKAFQEVRKDFETLAEKIESTQLEITWLSRYAVGMPTIHLQKRCPPSSGHVGVTEIHVVQRDTQAVCPTVLETVPDDGESQPESKSVTTAKPVIGIDASTQASNLDVINLAGLAGALQTALPHEGEGHQHIFSGLAALSDNMPASSSSHVTDMPSGALLGFSGEETSVWNESQPNPLGISAISLSSPLVVSRENRTSSSGRSERSASTCVLKDVSRLLRLQGQIAGDLDDASDLDSWTRSLPSDEALLQVVREDVAMELLWIEQAISSRKQYLAIKEKIEDTPGALYDT